MKTVFDASGWDAELSLVDSLPARARNAVKKRVRIVSLQVLTDIKNIMPVDTGAAHARWGGGMGGGISLFTGGQAAKSYLAGYGIWQEEDDGMTIIQGASLEPYEYIEALNEGSSNQAPIGFLDTAAEQGTQDLEEEIEQAFVELFN